MRQKIKNGLAHVVSAPLRALATINDTLNILFAAFYFFAIGPVADTGLFKQMNEVGNVQLWSGLILLGAVMSQYAFVQKSRDLLIWSQFMQSVGWIYALVLYAQFGTILAALPYVLRPVLTSIYVYLTASVRDPWAVDKPLID